VLCAPAYKLCQPLFAIGNRISPSRLMSLWILTAAGGERNPIVTEIAH
jgi:hypothetical protein